MINSVKMAEFERTEDCSDGASWTGQYGMGAGLGYSSSEFEQGQQDGNIRSCYSI